MRIIEGGLSGAGLRFCIIVARGEGFFSGQLLERAKDALLRHGVSHNKIDVVRTPGLWEIPIASKEAALSGRYDAIIALGSEAGDDRENNPVYEGVASVALAQRVPVSLGFLSPRSTQSVSEACNRGFEAAVAAIEMANLLNRMRTEKEAVTDA